MAVEVLIRRKIMETKAKEVSPLIVKLRSLATIQPGYISRRNPELHRSSGLERNIWSEARGIRWKIGKNGCTAKKEPP